MVRFNFEVDPDRDHSDKLNRTTAYRYLQDVYGLYLKVTSTFTARRFIRLKASLRRTGVVGGRSWPVTPPI